MQERKGKNMRSRRDFIKTCCALGSAGAIGMRLARYGMITANAQAATDYKALVCIYLSGGNDGNNLVVPLSSQGYADYSAGRSIDRKSTRLNSSHIPLSRM